LVRFNSATAAARQSARLRTRALQRRQPPAAIAARQNQQRPLRCGRFVRRLRIPTADAQEQQRHSREQQSAAPDFPTANGGMIDHTC